MDFYRNAERDLDLWRHSSYRKPLVLRGARQTGKTTLIKKFGKSFDSFIYLNLEVDQDRRLFENDLSVQDLIQYICLEKGIQRQGKTLLFLDEIQYSARAVMLMRYFYEELPELYVISAGSLLEIMMEKRKISFPVGRVEYLYLFPMCFEEFLMALGEETALGFYRQTPVPSLAHDKLSRLFRLYSFIGGMPEAVVRFIDTRDYTQVRHVLETIQSYYLDDMSKYQESSNEIKKTRLTYGTVSVQLSKKSARFQYKILKTGARAAEYENAIEWLASANLISRVYRAERIAKPLEKYKDIDDFKVFLSDTGLLCAQKGVRAEDVFRMEEELTDFKGGMTENYVETQFVFSGLKPFYWRNDKGTKKVDFVVSLNGKLIPVEVKSGGHVAATSLNEYVKLFKPAYSIRISEKNFGFENNIKSVPLYAVFCIRDS